MECTASLVVTGNEILRGQIIDTNTSYLARSLRAIGIQLCKVTVVPDIVDEIAQEICEASARSYIVFTSGGVGPTHDDVTYEGVAKGLRLQLELHDELVNFFTKCIPTGDHAKRFAIVPRPCDLIYIKAAETFPVVKAKNVYILPGSPKYFTAAVDTIVAQLNHHVPLDMEHIDVELNELSIADTLNEHAEQWKYKVNIGSYPQTSPHAFTRITLEGHKDDVAAAKLQLLQSLSKNKEIQSRPSLKKKFTREDAYEIINSRKSVQYIHEALNVIEECYERFKSSDIFITFNGGKDCTVVLHLVATIVMLKGYSQLICLYVKEDPFEEIDAFVQQAKYYYDIELIEQQCSMSKALRFMLNDRKNLKASFMGMRNGDPGAENLTLFAQTDAGWPSLMRVNPILNWTYSQVWQFLRNHNVPYCPLYDQGYTSLGSRNSTSPNPLLKDPNNSSTYFPAYTLMDGSAERRGRK